ncbi:hypothetical protein [Paenibacillus agri]|nr:hypothetical protein [Paenibacillus agri]
MPTEISTNLRGVLKMQIYFEAAEANYNKQIDLVVADAKLF